MSLRLIFLVIAVATFSLSCGSGGSDSQGGTSGGGSSSSSGGSSGGGDGGGGSSAPGPAGDNETICEMAGVATDPDGQHQLPELQEPPMPTDGDHMAKEHMRVLSLVSYSKVTHAAVKDGDWCDPETWHNKEVPGDGANVVVPEDIRVRYGVVSEASLNTLRVDGELSFLTQESSKLVADTIYIDPRGTLEIGTTSKPITASEYVHVIIADNGQIDVSLDPMLFGRGLISQGKVTIHGALKTAHLAVEVDPIAGDDTLVLARMPENWRRGDTLVIAGTQYSGWKWNAEQDKVTYHGTQDEVRTIVDINGRLVTLDAPLKFDHRSPRADLKTRVANFTRNVSIASEGGDSLPAHQRGHVMFMHNPDVDVRYAEFRHLGRTDKSFPSVEAADLDTVKPDSNVRGRYSFHFHRTGTGADRTPGMAVGNTVFGSPGWGYVHHDSHAYFYDNVSYDTFGAGFVAETGNETGAWVRNLAIRAEGILASSPKVGSDVATFEMGRTGDGFWFQGRLLRSIHNVAASVNNGFVYFHRGEGMLTSPPDHFMLPEALGYGVEATADDIPIRNFHGNQAFASTVGLFVSKANPMQQHDIYTELTDFTAWEVQSGAVIEYTSHYLLKDFDLVGSTPEQYRAPKTGIRFSTNTTDMVVHNARIENFAEGIELSKEHTENNQRAVGKDQFVVIGAEFIGVEKQLQDYNADLDLVLESTQLEPGRFSVALDNNGRFEYLDPSTYAGSGVAYRGTKVDSIGSNPLPAGGDELGMPHYDMIGLLEREGYYRTEDGEAYAVVEQYFSDRATGEIHKLGLKTFLGPEVEAAIASGNSAWSGAVYIGEIDLDSTPPVANDDQAQTTKNNAIKVDLLGNDSDSDGDVLRIDGIVQPRHGAIKNPGDGTVIYYPDLGFTGKDRFKYWVTDGQGNFSPGTITVQIN